MFLTADPQPPQSAITAILHSISRLLPRPAQASRVGSQASQAHPELNTVSGSSAASVVDLKAQSVATQALDAILSRSEIRVEAWHRERDLRIVEALAIIISGHVSQAHSPMPSPPNSGRSTPQNASSNGALSPQMQYHIGFAFWLLSFEPEFSGEASKSLGLVQLLADLARYAVKEKIVRVVLGTFRVCDCLVCSLWSWSVLTSK
jgi:hypothetical protein